MAKLEQWRYKYLYGNVAFYPRKGDLIMATIRAMAGQTASMYTIAAKGLSYGNTSNSTASLWGSSSSKSNSSYNTGSTLASIYNNSTELSGLLKEYDTTKAQFNTQFSSNMSGLSDASAKLKTTNFSVKGKIDEETSSNIAGVVDTVSKFVDKFNSANSFLNNLSDTSTKLSNLANNFSDAKYFSRSLNTVGITVGSEGQLKLDKDMLTSALKENPSSVESVLGKNGLAGRTESKIQAAKMQQSTLFPTAAQMMGTSDINTTYSARATTAQLGYSMVGNLLNMYF